MREDRGAATVEFTLVGTLLTILALAVVQLGILVYARNVVHDAAVEGAYYGALADTSAQDGAVRTEQLIALALGGLAAKAQAEQIGADGDAEVIVRVTATLPVLGLLGIPRAMEVTARAPAESFG